MERRLAAIIAVDVVGYSRLMEQDETGTFARLRAHRRELFEPEIAAHHGHIFKLTGDGLLAEFASVVDAVECAVALQEGMTGRNAAAPTEHRIEARIGVNLGDVIVDRDDAGAVDMHGEGVIIANRLQALAEPGGVCVSQTVVNHVGHKIAVGFEFVGEQRVKNITEPVRVYRVLTEPEAAGRMVATRKSSRIQWRWPAAAAAFAIVVAGAIAWQRPWEPRVEAASVENMALPLPDKPSIAVLPFTNMSDDPKQEYFADGLTDGLITELSQVSGLFVISRNSTFAYKGKTVAPKQVSEELGVRYVLEGSVQRANEQLRINAQLIDALSGGHEWAGKFDGSLADVFALQDQVTRNIADALAVRLTETEHRTLGQRETSVAAAYDEFLRGWEHYQRTTPADFVKAIPHFEQAIALDPTYARAQAALAMLYFRSYDQGWTASFGMTADAAFRKAREYLDSAKVHPTSTSHQVAGNISRSRGWYDDAVKEFQAAIALDPSDSWSYAYLAYSSIYARRPAEAATQIETAMRLDPHFPALFVFYRGLAQFEQNRMEEAAVTLKEAVRLNPDDTWPFAFLAASYGHLGREKEGVDAIAALNSARVRQGGAPLVMVELKSDFPGFKPPPESPLIRGLLRLGIPYNFDSPAFDSLRLTAREVEALFFGHRLHGRTMRTGAEHGVSVSADGTAVRFGDWEASPGSSGTARLEGDRLCFALTTTTYCGSIFRNAGGTKATENEYLWFDGWAYPFSQIE